MVVAATTFAIALTAAPAAHASPSASDLQKQIDKQGQDLEKVVESYNALNISLKKTQDDQKKLQASLAPAKVALANASAQVNTIAGTAYQQGPVGPASALLSGDGANLIQKMSYLEVIQAGNQRDINTFTETTQTFTQRQTALNTTKAKQSAQLQEIAAHRKKIESDIKDLKAKRVAAFGTANEKATFNGTIPSISGSAGVAVRFAYDQVGDSYGFGDAGPNSWDCSGLTMGAWGAAGKSLPHNAAAQWDATTRISRGDLKAGDLVFYNGLAHVAIYVGNDQVIDAPTEGKPVDVRSIDRGMPVDGYGRVT
ncbi:D-gamma-glutamyl-meso-diaminopimelic acid endopeptidase [Actinoplanes sp. TBRC 11911]|uniref:C40 family peptidase n=1 Tax=Actinoplanes sp. TBRC 11911 TaxID=2729386 RepID=UPI00145E0552|nr:NlpC/P60 family protein [Actinoplanes sp. TBRC 11911]NMO55570.1 D-gamma-glutamyl-meso-diaminopimelic acid endopeptidase [Actinoplanes sp. TBRC 11911]